jgi:hypothetical protein
MPLEAPVPWLRASSGCLRGEGSSAEPQQAECVDVCFKRARRTGGAAQQRLGEQGQPAGARGLRGAAASARSSAFVYYQYGLRAP